jgi:hypothetical protein
VADESVVGQDAAQVGVAFKDDAVQVECLALEPVGSIPDLVDGIHDRKIIVGQRTP